MTKPKTATKINPNKQESNYYQLKLFSKENCQYSHSVRLALKIKNVDVETVIIDDVRDLPQEVEELLQHDDKLTLPMLLERDFVISRPGIILQYIDERFPAPPLMPETPNERVSIRNVIYHINHNIVDLAYSLSKDKSKKHADVVRQLQATLVSFSYANFEDFVAKEHEVNMVDCILAPVLWRLKTLGIDINKQRGTKYKWLAAYMSYLFSQRFFIDSCTEKELEIQL